MEGILRIIKNYLDRGWGEEEIKKKFKIDFNISEDKWELIKNFAIQNGLDIKEKGLFNAKKLYMRKYNKIYYAQNREKILQWHKDYYWRHVNQIKERNRQYKEKFKDKFRKASKEYYRKHREELLQKKKQYYLEHRQEYLEKFKQYYQQHREEILRKRKEKRQALKNSAN